MGLQIILKAKDPLNVEKVLGEITSQSEVFQVNDGLFGVSIPTKVVDSIGEQILTRKLNTIEHFDLWEGVWKKPKSKLKFW